MLCTFMLEYLSVKNIQEFFIKDRNNINKLKDNAFIFLS